MKILVTGAAGQLGREVTLATKGRGHGVLVATRSDLDITDEGAVRQTVDAYRPDVVVNCAAYVDADAAESDPERAFLVNGSAIGYLAEACNECGAALANISSDYVFDGTKKEPYTVEDATNPLNKYGESKVAGERELRERANKYFLIRTSWVFGDGKNSFPMKVLAWAASGDVVRVVDDQVASPTYVADLAEAIALLVESEKFGTYHITNSGECSRYEWAEFILRETGWRGELRRARSEEFATPARRPGYSTLDNSVFEEAAGYKLPSWQDATMRFLKRIGKV